ncbi:MAG: hypothetical protein AAGF46_12960 [Pseudomonadota bacterium]
MADDSKAFYLGYAAAPPAAVRTWLKRSVPSLLLATGLVLGFFAGAQQPVATATFEFGAPKTVSGIVVLDPYPALLITEGEHLQRVHLVGEGKHGADMRAYAGQAVSLSGTLIERGAGRMYEVVAGSVTVTDPAPVVPERSTRRLGAASGRGEIVDSKCHLGVMQPGEGTGHRACAIRCINGGVPPLFVSTGDNGQPRYWLLTDVHGEPLGAGILPLVGKRVEIAGELIELGNTHYLRVDPERTRLL